jgi:hypothetical protein
MFRIERALKVGVVEEIPSGHLIAALDAAVKAAGHWRAAKHGMRHYIRVSFIITDEAGNAA